MRRKGEGRGGEEEVGGESWFELGFVEEARATERKREKKGGRASTGQKQQQTGLILVLGKRLV